MLSGKLLQGCLTRSAENILVERGLVLGYLLELLANLEGARIIEVEEVNVDHPVVSSVRHNQLGQEVVELLL